MPRPRVKPHNIVLAIGVIAAAGALTSGILPRVTKWEDTSKVQRHLFVNIPDPLYWAFYITIATMLLVTAWLISLRVRNYERGQPDDRRTTKENAKRRFGDFRAGVWMRTLLRDPVAGVMHSFIYFGFLGLFLATIISEVQDQAPESLKFLHGQTYEAYSFGADLAGAIFLIGIGWAVVRRYVQRPYRIRIKTKPEDAAMLGTLGLIGITGFTTEGLRIAAVGEPSFEKWSFIGWPLAKAMDGLSATTLSEIHRWSWSIHVL
ncbi:MAG TPA: iron-sulfur protein, partial [Acidimicrobiia bacterium]